MHVKGARQRGSRHTREQRMAEHPRFYFWHHSFHVRGLSTSTASSSGGDAWKLLLSRRRRSDSPNINPDRTVVFAAEYFEVSFGLFLHRQVVPSFVGEILIPKHKPDTCMLWNLAPRGLSISVA